MAKNDCPSLRRADSNLRPDKSQLPQLIAWMGRFYCLNFDVHLSRYAWDAILIKARS